MSTDEDYSTAVVRNFLRSMHDPEMEEEPGDVADPAPSDLLVLPRRMATFCGASHPLLPELLCGRLSGHGGNHAAEEDTAWDEAWQGATTGEVDR